MVVIVLCKKEEFKYKDVVEAKWCDVVVRICPAAAKRC